MHALERSTAARARRGGLAAVSGMFLALSAGCSGAASTQGRFVAVHNAFVALGLNQVGHISEGSLAEGGTARFPMELDAQCHTFVAFGGDGARDIDVSLLDANNQRVAGDTSHDSQATLQFCPPAHGRYTLALRMAAGGGSYVLSSWRGAAHGASGGAAAAAGGSDTGTCQSPIPIQIGQTVTGDTSHGRSANAGSCLGEGTAPELVYSLTLEHRLLVTVAAEQDYDGAIYIRSGCEEPQSEPGGTACNDDDNDTSHSRVSTVLEPGTYFIFADGYGDAHGSFTLTVTGGDVPSPQEVCQQATALAVGQAVSGQTSGDANVFQGTCAAHTPGPDHVYRLEVPQESRLQLFQESDYDGALYVRRACADTSTELACNDDAEDVQHSRINTVVPPGTYYVFTDGYSAQASGNFTLEADLSPVAGGSGMAGDTCADAQPLTNGQTVDGNTFLAHDDVVTPCGAPQEGYDTVYRLDVTSRSHVRLFLESSDNRQAVIYLTRGCGTAAASAANASIACRAGAIGDDNAVDAVLDRGTYYVVIDSAQPRAFGRYRLTAHIEDIGALERVCRSAPALHTGQTVTGTTSGDDRFQSTCAGGSHNAESLYRVVLRRRSFVRLALTSTTPNYDPSIYLRSNCTDPSTERACNDNVPGDTRHSLIEATLDAGTYTVFIDGFGTSGPNAHPNAGGYSLEVTINPQ